MVVGHHWQRKNGLELNKFESGVIEEIMMIDGKTGMSNTKGTNIFVDRLLNMGETVSLVSDTSTLSALRAQTNSYWRAN